jgi:hypothetical protein
LAEAAERLNAEEPQTSSLRDLTCGGDDEAGNVALGRTQNAEWNNPAAIANGAYMTCNDFGSHRPCQVRDQQARLRTVPLDESHALGVAMSYTFNA